MHFGNNYLNSHIMEGVCTEKKDRLLDLKKVDCGWLVKRMQVFALCLCFLGLRLDLIRQRYT